MRISKALCYETNGTPEAVLGLTDIPLEEMNDDRVCIQQLASPLHPSDFGLIQGRYGRSVPLPAVGGREGLGKIVESGKNAKHLSPGTHVRLPEIYGTWREYVVAEASDLEVVPPSIPVEMASMAFINPPTAWRLLTDFAPLRPGDWIVQNAATSAVGLSVIQMAHEFGFRTLNFVRNPEAKEWLKPFGPTVVLEEKEYAGFADFTGGERAKLGLNSIGGNSLIGLIKCMSDNGVLVTIGGVSDEKIRFPTRSLIFNNLQFRGFWMDRWSRTRPREEVQECHRQIYTLIRHKKLMLPVAGRYGLDQWTEAITQAQTHFRRGKILFKSQPTKDTAPICGNDFARRD
jgi:NADPH:quinone reductase-like Zn-dependent oxidoreductase